jgi:hypothetical protein
LGNTVIYLSFRLLISGVESGQLRRLSSVRRSSMIKQGPTGAFSLTRTLRESVVNAYLGKISSDAFA